jgi:uncharacterized membrane protein
MKLGIFLLVLGVLLLGYGFITVLALQGSADPKLVVGFMYAYLISALVMFVLGTLIVRFKYRLVKGKKDASEPIKENT